MFSIPMKSRILFAITLAVSSLVQPLASAPDRVLDLGTRLELFVDEFLIERISGGAERRLHRPVPREVIMTFGDHGKPWESVVHYPTVIQDGDRMLLYYSGRFTTKSGGKGEVACVITSRDGIQFSRPELGLHDLSNLVEGYTTNNNIIWLTGAPTHHFTPFLDTNPNARPEERFKAIARHPKGKEVGGALSGFTSPDGLRWKILDPDHGFASSPTDSQNLGFWDPNRQAYVCYMRGRRPGGGKVRDVRIATSPDFRSWTDPELIDYSDDRQEHLYTNGIRPYYRAPHLYIGTPNRFVPQRTRFSGEPRPGINDVIFMSSRDGKRFDRWAEAFLRPAPGGAAWSNRSYYPTANTVQTSPTELSLYWNENTMRPDMLMRRGTLRIDGFVSVRAGGTPGELLTRALRFSGDQLVVNFETSALGSLRCELTDAAGQPRPRFAMAESEELFGNEIEQVVSWKSGSDLRRLRGQTVRLRVRLHDADLYSIRFAAAP